MQVKVTCSYSAPASKPNKTACLVFKTSGKITCECVFLEIFKNVVIFNLRCLEYENSRLAVF